MKRLYLSLLIPTMSILFISCTDIRKDKKEEIVIENEQVKLIVGTDGTAESLVYKPTNEECLHLGDNISLFSVTQERPYNNEVKLAHPNKNTTYRADTVYRVEDNLIVGFETIPYEAVIKVKVASAYIRFSLEDFMVEEEDYLVNITPPPVFEMCFLQLPVRDREHFGEWLNVGWDDDLSINILGTDQYARIDAEKRNGYRIMKADAVKDVKLRGVGAALIVCGTENLLDNIAQVEEDYDLPEGVKSRRNERIKFSYYWSGNVNPENIDQHLLYAKMGGFRSLMLYYPSFIESNGYRKLGNYDWNRSLYPNGRDDLRNMLNKIEDNGMITGFHFLHTHIGRDSKYITPEADHRLNLLDMFTLAKPLGENDTTIYVEQNPEGLTMADKCRVLKIGTELISYKSYTTTRPYKFNGCIRGIDQTRINSQPKGYIFGLLDVSEFGSTSVYLDQNTSLQDEIAGKIADIYQAGFKFIYFDGSEGVNSPFWYHVSAAQYNVYRRLKPAPLFAEGAAKTHFSWHMVSGGNAFDVFKPEYLKEAIRKFPAEEAPRMKADFTRVNFGWLGYWVPDENTVGTQPDMLEYVTSRAAAWDCPVSIHADLKKFDSHPRTPDNLEVLRRWEEVRAENWLTEEQKQMLQNLDQEHILLLNEQKEFELLPYDQIMNVANDKSEVRAFIFERKNDIYIVYWHISDSKRIALSLNPEKITLFESLGQEVPVHPGQDINSVLLPVGKRRYIATDNLTRDQIITAFHNATIIN
jgi:hypothetical protein